MNAAGIDFTSSIWMRFINIADTIHWKYSVNAVLYVCLLGSFYKAIR